MTLRSGGSIAPIAFLFSHFYFAIPHFAQTVSPDALQRPAMASDRTVSRRPRCRGQPACLVTTTRIILARSMAEFGRPPTRDMIWTPDVRLAAGRIDRCNRSCASNPKFSTPGPANPTFARRFSSGDGVYKSGDGGQTWKNIGLRDSRQISRIVVDPNNPEWCTSECSATPTDPMRSEVYTSRPTAARPGRRSRQRAGHRRLRSWRSQRTIPMILFAGTWNTHRPPWSTYASAARSGRWHSIVQLTAARHGRN